MDCVFDFFLVSIQSSNTNINDDLPKEDLTRYGKKKNQQHYHYVMKYKTVFFIYYVFFEKFWNVYLLINELRSYIGRNVATTDVQIEDQLDSHLNEHSETQCNSCQFYSNNSL